MSIDEQANNAEMTDAKLGAAIYLIAARRENPESPQWLLAALSGPDLEERILHHCLTVDHERLSQDERKLLIRVLYPMRVAG